MNKYGKLIEHLDHYGSIEYILQSWGRWAGQDYDLGYVSPALKMAREKFGTPKANYFSDEEMCCVDSVIAKNIVPYDRKLLKERFIHRLTYRELGNKFNISTTQALRFVESAREVLLVELKHALPPKGNGAINLNTKKLC